MKALTISFPLMLLIIPSYLWAGTASPITAIQLIAGEMSQWMTYNHYQVIGVCSWLESDPLPKMVVTPELDEYEPDLVVTVFNQVGNDPWFEANTMDKLVTPLASTLVQQFTGFGLTQGNVSNITQADHYDNLRRKIVDVIGNPLELSTLPFPNLKLDTTPYRPYYQSELDVLGLLGIAEALQPATYDPLSHYVGSGLYQHWGYEFPRSMTVDVDNDFKAAVLTALHAADIVTNHNDLHTVHSTEDSCGINCAVSNVVEETNDNNEKWQEIYPLNKHIVLGQNDIADTTSLGSTDDIAGNGNYVFVVWRHYRGCVQHHGQFVWAAETVSPTQKR